MERHGDYDALFAPRPRGWLGADGIASVQVSTGRSVWLFGDTMVGSVSGEKRVLEALINNSVAVEARPAAGPPSAEFYWDTSTAPPRAFFPHAAGGPDEYYWPVAAAMLRGELFVFCYAVRSSGSWFETPGTAVIRVANPSDPPGRWRRRTYDLGLGGPHRAFVAAAVVEEPYVYLLGFDDPDQDDSRRRAVLARAPVSALLAGGGSVAFEYWVQGSSGPAWGPEPGDLVTLFEPGATELAPQRDAGLGLYILPVKPDLGPDIYLTSAPELTGPWSDPVMVYRVPEHEAGFPIISYAVKAHPELSTSPGDVVVSYATNSPGDLAPLLTPEGLGVYVPRFVRVKLSPRHP